MKPLTIANPDIILGLQDEIRRSEESRYDHRLHGVLLVAQGMTCPEVATLLGDARRTVQYWVKRFEQDGLAGLVEKERPGASLLLDLRANGGSQPGSTASSQGVRSRGKSLGWKDAVGFR